jgi:hypothetical protein
VYVDEHLEAVRMPRFARDAAHRDRLWRLTQQAIGDPQWPWQILNQDAPQ